jgi:hypothetical protein
MSDVVCRHARQIAAKHTTLESLTAAINAHHKLDLSPDALACRYRRWRKERPKEPMLKDILGLEARKAKQEAEAVEADRLRRLHSDYENLRPDDQVGVGNDGRVDREASREKRQEYSESMGRFAKALRKTGGVPDDMPEDLGGYVGLLAEQERRFANRRVARTVSITAANEALHLAQFKDAAKLFDARIVPKGFATSLPKPGKRTVVTLLSDWHLGSDLSAVDNPIPFGNVEEARRLEHVVHHVIDYKPEHREDSELLVLLNGDMIDGNLQHDLKDGAPLIEQKLRFWHLSSLMMAEFARSFKRVRVVPKPGNHGRDKLRHPGRATSSKWDGHEWEMYYALMRMCSELKNVQWELDRKAWSLVDVHGSKMLVTHGDTHVKMAHPDKGAEKNAMLLDRYNANKTFGDEFQAACFGHWHTPRHKPGTPDVVVNGMLQPPNGHSISEGYVAEPCGQWVWEAVEGFPVGDARYIRVGPDQDNDERLGKVLTPFEWPKGF